MIHMARHTICKARYSTVGHEATCSSDWLRKRQVQRMSEFKLLIVNQEGYMQSSHQSGKERAKLSGWGCINDDAKDWGYESRQNRPFQMAVWFQICNHHPTSNGEQKGKSKRQIKPCTDNPRIQQPNPQQWSYRAVHQRRRKEQPRLPSWLCSFLPPHLVSVFPIHLQHKSRDH